MSSFNDFREFLLSEPPEFPLASAITLGIDIYKTELDAVMAMYRLFRHFTKLEDLVLNVAKVEIERLVNENLLFRDTSIASTLLKTYIESQAGFLLESYLAELLPEILQTGGDFEVVESLLPNRDSLKANQKNLMEASQKLFNAITSLARQLSPNLRCMLARISRAVVQRFPSVSQETLTRSTIAALLFLRFICPKIVAFDLQRHNLDKKHRRKLVLLAKILQMVANNVPFSNDDMQVMNIFLTENRQKFYQFCQELTIDDNLGFQCQFVIDTSLYEDYHTIYKYVREFRGDIENSILQLTKEVQASSFGTPCEECCWEDELWNAFQTANHFNNPEDIYVFYPFAEARMEYNRPPVRPLSQRGISTGDKRVQQLNEILQELDTIFQAKKTGKLVKNPSFGSLAQSKEISPNSVKFFSKLLKKFKAIKPSEPVSPRLSPQTFGNLVLWWETEITTHNFTILIYYRGLWCPWCRSYMKVWSSYLATVQYLGGAIYGVCAQEDRAIDLMRKNGVEFHLINDVNNTLAQFLGVEVIPWVGYKNGVAQPAIFVFDAKGEVIYNWKSIPTIANFYGSRDRPAPKDVLSTIMNSYLPKEDDVTRSGRSNSS